MDSAFYFQINSGDSFPMATILVPTPLRRLTAGQAKVEVAGEDVGTLIQAIDAPW